MKKYQTKLLRKYYMFKSNKYYDKQKNFSEGHIF